MNKVAAIETRTVGQAFATVAVVVDAHGLVLHATDEAPYNSVGVVLERAHAWAETQGIEIIDMAELLHG